MFLYRDEAGNKVIQIRKRCHCFIKRNHICTKRVHKFCFCWNKVPWYKGLWLIALMTIIFGILEFAILHGVALRGTPSAVHAYVLFPFLSGLAYLQLLFFISLGIMMWIGLYLGNLRAIKCFPWLLLLGYVFAALLLAKLIVEGNEILHTLVWSDNGMIIKSNLERESKALVNQGIIFYIVMILLIIALVLFTTYMIILTLSWIDKLVCELDDEMV